MKKELKEFIIDREGLRDIDIGLEDKTLIIGFNEPKFRKSQKDLVFGDIDAKLNARMITYFLPAVEVARKQKEKPRFYVMSALNSALMWNAENDEQKKIMIANNSIKMDFLRSLFEKFFKDDFILVEYVVPQDMLKIPESKILYLWNLIEEKYPEELVEVRFQLIKFLYPRKFNVQKHKELNSKQLEELKTVDATSAFKYAISHLFVLGDLNFEGNYVHSAKGYFSLGGEQEIYFNKVRDLAYKVLKDYGGVLFERKIVTFDNSRLVLRDKVKVPIPYNGMLDGHGKLLEVTYENERDLDYYESQEKLKPQMDYMYENILSKNEYEEFWNEYKNRYFNLKERYRKAYKIKSNW